MSIRTELTAERLWSRLNNTRARNLTDGKPKTRTEPVGDTQGRGPIELGLILWHAEASGCNIRYEEQRADNKLVRRRAMGQGTLSCVDLNKPSDYDK